MVTKKGISGASLLEEKDNVYTLKNSWSNLWQECLDFADPAHDGITSLNSKGSNVSSTRLIDICMRCTTTYASGLYSFLCNGDWLKFDSGIAKDKTEPSLVSWWSEASNVVIEKIESSNFKDEITQYFKSLGVIGTSAMLTEADMDGNLSYKFFDISEYAIAENNKGEVDSVYRRLRFSAKQAIQEFGYKKVDPRVVKAYETQSKEKFDYWHIVKPRLSRNKKSEANVNKPYASYYVEELTKKIIKESGFDTFPFSVCRVEKTRKEIYGRSPMSYSIATARVLQYYEELFLSISNRKANPNWLVDKQARVENLTNAKDGVTYYDSRRSSNKPERLIENIDINFTLEDKQSKEKDIEQAFFVDLFDALKDYRNMTATETQERVSSSISRISPVVSRVINEGLRNIAERSFILLLERGMLPELPKGHEDRIKNVKANFYGRLSQLNEELELNNLSRGAGFIMQFAEAMPSMLDYLNADKLAVLGLVNSNAPNTIIRTEIEVRQMRNAREEQAKQQEMMAQANMGADIMSKSSKAPEDGSFANQVMEGMNG